MTPEADRVGYSPPPPNDRLKHKKAAARRNSPERRNVVKESSEPEPEPASNDPVLEARRRKFESMREIDPVKANKKIKLIKNVEQSEPEEDFEEGETVEASARLSEELDEDLTLNEGEEFELEPYEDYEDADENLEEQTVVVEPVKEKKLSKDKTKKKKKKDKELYEIGKLKGDEKKRKKKHKEVNEEGPSEEAESGVFEEVNASEEGDLRAELSRRRAERMNRVAPVQSARLVQSAFKGVVSE